MSGPATGSQEDIARRRRLVGDHPSLERAALDAQHLLAAGRKLEALEAHDVLPHTVHVELPGWFGV